jgi:hypothetical protein
VKVVVETKPACLARLRCRGLIGCREVVEGVEGEANVEACKVAEAALASQKAA